MKKSASILLLVLAWSTSQVPAQTTQTQIVKLRQGWNLVSFRVLPDTPTPALVLSGLSADPTTAITAIWSYDGAAASWQQWVPGSLLNNDQASAIGSFAYYRGYWINAALPNLTLTIAGRESPGGRISFSPGWNLLGFPAGDAQSANLAQVDALFREHVQGVDPDVDLIYALGTNGKLLRWDFTIDRRLNDFNADGVPNTQADTTFKQDYGLPDDIEGLTESTPSADEFAALVSGEGYWVHARRSFELIPLLKTSVPADLDNVPVNNFPGPEDWDLDRDGVLDVNSWSAPAPVTGSDQAGLNVPAGQKTVQAIVNNVGEGILRWQASFVPSPALAAISAEAVVVSPNTGETLTDTDTLTLTVNRSGLSPGTHEGDLRIDSNGGVRVFRVFIEVPDLIGDFRGLATIDTVDGKKISLPSIDFTLSLYPSPDGTLRGQIRSDDSSHFPLPVSVQGERLSAERTSFIMLASYQLPANAILQRAEGSLDTSIAPGSDSDTVSDVHTLNPFPRPVFREMALVGERSREDVALTGTFHDTLLGITADPILIQGTFELVRESLVPSVQPTAGATAPCAPPAGSQGIPEGTEKLFVLDGTLGCPALLEPVLIDSVRVYAQLQHANKSQLRIRLLSPTEDPSDPNAGVLLYHGQQAGAPSLTANDVSWPLLFSPATQGLFPQEGPTALTGAYRGQLANQGNGQWRLGITDTVTDGSVGKLTKWLISFGGPIVYELSGRVVDLVSNPLRGVLVAVTGAEVLHAAVTDAEGRFRIANLPPYRYRLAFTKDGYRCSASAPVVVDLVASQALADVRMEPIPVTAADLWITPASGWLGQNGTFTTRLRYVAPALVPGDTYQFIVQQYGKDPSEPNPGEAAFPNGLRPPVPVGEALVIPAAPGPAPEAELLLTNAGIYSVAVVVFRDNLEVGRVEEPIPKAFRQYVVQVQERLPSGTSGGGPLVLADSGFVSGGISEISVQGEPERSFRMTCAFGSPISGRSAGPVLVLEGGVRLVLPSAN